jgi:Uncharacterized protein conserved in bacteria
MMPQRTATTTQRSESAVQFAPPGAVRLHGLLGEALAANHRGRLAKFIVDETSPAIALFAPVHAHVNHAGDWYGEHAGKWLYAASKAAARTGDAILSDRVRRVADYLVSLQDAEGYLGNYAPDRRFMRKQPAKPVSWDGAPSVRTWDIWTHSYLILGLLEAHRLLGIARYLEAACRIGDLCWRTLTSGGIDVTDLGNHHGMSATVLMDPAMELHFATGEQRYLDLATLILEQANRNPRLALLTQVLAGADASEIATGKAYQLMWNVVGLAKLHRANGDAALLRAAVSLWRNVRDHHLTLGGGPWGGVGQRSREVFNPPTVFSPYGYVETCSTLAWMQLNRELLAITGEAAYAEEIERSAYNDLLGAQAPDGEDWCYYSFANGRRVHTTYWRCCKSSGAMALEELSSIAYATTADGVQINLLGPSEAELQLRGVGTVRLEQRTEYPFDGEVCVRVAPERNATFTVNVRIPQWADGASIRVNGASCPPGPVHREWRQDDVIAISLPMSPRTHFRAHSNSQESRAPDDSPVCQEVLHFDYVAITRGPLVYATGLIDGYKIEETLRVPAPADAAWLETVPAAGAAGPDVRMAPLGRPALMFSPYYRAGGRRDRTWRLTWMPLAPEPQ